MQPLLRHRRRLPMMHSKNAAAPAAAGPVDPEKKAKAVSMRR